MKILTDSWQFATYLTTALQLPDDFLMTGFQLPDSWLTTAWRRFSNEYIMHAARVLRQGLLYIWREEILLWWIMRKTEEVFCHKGCAIDDEVHCPIAAWLLDDCLKTAWCLPDNLLTTPWWLLFDCPTNDWWLRLRDNCLIATRRLPDDFQATSWWLSDNCWTVVFLKKVELSDDNNRQNENYKKK